MFRLRALALRRFLRSPLVIVGEIVAIAIATGLGASLPQAGSATVESLARLREGGEMQSMLVRAFALDDLFHSRWFLGLTLMATASLWIVILEQVRRLRVGWTQRMTPAHFSSAPLRAQFERPARGGGTEPLVNVWAEKRFGLTGSVMLHVGLMLVIVAGACRALFGTEAVVDLVEGETLPPTAAAWAGQFSGILGQPFRLNSPVTMNTVKSAHYKDGDLRELQVEVSVEGAAGAEKSQLAVNHDLKVGGGRLFLGSDFGPAALLEWEKPGVETKREAALLAGVGKGRYEGISGGPEGMRVFVRAEVGAEGQHPSLVELRVMKDGALLFTGDARVGQSALLPGGVRLALRGTPFWARLRGSRDSALWLAYAGFTLIMAGSVIIFTLIKLDGCLVITPLGATERVFLAMKPQRFAPLFAERFQRMVEEEGGSVADIAPRKSVEGAPAGSAASVEKADPVGGRTAGASVFAMLLCGLVLGSGCQPSAREEARGLVEHYNQVVSEAYRRGDVKLIDPVVGVKEGRKILGLIGVRLDLGLTLDSELLSLDITGVEQQKDEMRVRTKEQWRYRDRKIGSGEQVGEASKDSYEMLYVFKKTEGAWLVEEIQFTSDPKVSRKQTTWIAERGAEHTTANSSNKAEVQKP